MAIIKTTNLTCREIVVTTEVEMVDGNVKYFYTSIPAYALNAPISVHDDLVDKFLYEAEYHFPKELVFEKKYTEDKAKSDNELNESKRQDLISPEFDKEVNALSSLFSGDSVDGESMSGINVDIDFHPKSTKKGTKRTPKKSK